jgi:8-oxo-dGTP pyrophosphatase MutT (NUDIX family)
MNNPETLLRNSLRGNFTMRYPSPAAAGKLSAVLILLRNRSNAWEVFFTRRSEQLADHRGQIAFPGGRAEAGDSGPLQTALREACEEIGLAPGAVRPLGILEPVDTSSGFRVWPVVGILRRPVEPRPSSSEVAEGFWIPLDWLAAEGKWENRRVDPEAPDHSRIAVFFESYQGHVVWGATAAIMVHLLEILHGDGAE